MRPVMRSGSQLDIGRLAGGTGEGFSGQLAIAKAPCCKPGHPFAFGNPWPSAFGNGFSQREGVLIIVLDVEAPRHPLTPLGARFGAEQRIDLLEDRIGAGGIVIDDGIEDRGGVLRGYRAIIDPARKNALGRGALTAEALGLRECGEVFEPATLTQTAQLFGLRKFYTLREPVRDLLCRYCGTVGMGVIFGERHLVQDALTLIEQRLDLVPLFPVDCPEDFAIMLALLARKNAWDRCITRGAPIIMRSHAARNAIGLRGGGLSERECGEKGSSKQRRAQRLVRSQSADHSIHLRQNRALRRGIDIMLSSPSLTINGIDREPWLISRKDLMSSVKSWPKSGEMFAPKARTRFGAASAM